MQTLFILHINQNAVTFLLSIYHKQVNYCVTNSSC